MRTRSDDHRLHGVVHVRSLRLAGRGELIEHHAERRRHDDAAGVVDKGARGVVDAKATPRDVCIDGVEAVEQHEITGAPRIDEDVVASRQAAAVPANREAFIDGEGARRAVADRQEPAVEDPLADVAWDELLGKALAAEAQWSTDDQRHALRAALAGPVEDEDGRVHQREA